jgi:uncharacterized protein (DUF885 family)
MNDPSFRKNKFENIHNIFVTQYDKLVKQPDSLDNSIMTFQLQNLINEYKYHPYVFPITHQRGWHLWIDDHDQIPLVDFIRGVEDAIYNMRIGIALARTHHKIVLKSIIKQCIRQQKKYKNNIQVKNTFTSLLNFLRSEYLPCCRSSIGTESDEEYMHYIKTEVTIIENAQCLYNLGMQQLSNTMNNIKKLLNGTNYKKYYKANRSNIKKTYVKDVTDNINKTHINIGNDLYVVRSNKTFTTHRVDVPFKLKFISDKYAAIASYHMNQDGIGVATFNTKRKQSHSTLNTIIAHEIYPGHHFEICNNNKLWYGTNLWLLTHFYGYIEGWALYVEELWSNTDDKHQQLGRLFMEALRDIRIIVDSGIHSHKCGKWTYLECMKFIRTGIFRGVYIVDNFKGLTMTNNNIHSEILSMSVRPAYGMCYKIGKIYFTKEKKKQMENGYTEQTIHDRFLSRRIPLDLLCKLFEPEYKPNVEMTDTDLITKMTPTNTRILSQNYSNCCGH